MWNYASMSAAAKNAGGPQIFMNGLVESGVKRGRIEGLVVAGIVVAACATAGFCVKKIRGKFFNSDAKNAEIVDSYMTENLKNGVFEEDIDNSSTENNISKDEFEGNEALGDVDSMVSGKEPS